MSIDGPSTAGGLTREAPEPGVVVLRLNRPERLNALNLELVVGLRQALVHAVAEGARALLITGTGRAFSAGFDLKEELAPDDADRFGVALQEISREIREMPVPVLAAVNGLAVGGGCEIALACDLVFAAPEATFTLPEVRLGTVVGAGLSFMLPRRVGFTDAAELILLGRPLAALEAKRIGLINEVVPSCRLFGEASQIARELAERPPAVINAAKRVLRQGLECGHEDALALELNELKRLSDLPEALEAVSNFRAHSRYEAPR